MIAGRRGGTQLRMSTRFLLMTFPLCLFSVLRRGGEEAVGTALSESGRGAQAPEGPGASGRAQSGKSDTRAVHCGMQLLAMQ